MTLSTHRGGCHCGAVRFQFEAEPSATALRCNCTICAASGFVQIIIPEQQFSLLSGEADLSTYTFGTGVARHHFCRRCGVKSFYIPRSNPDGVAININCVDQRTFNRISIEDFDGVNWEDNAAAIAHLSKPPLA